MIVDSFWRYVSQQFTKKKRKISCHEREASLNKGPPVTQNRRNSFFSATFIYKKAWVIDCSCPAWNFISLKLFRFHFVMKVLVQGREINSIVEIDYRRNRKPSLCFVLKSFFLNPRCDNNEENSYFKQVAIARLSQRFWTTTSRCTVNQELKL